MTTAPVTVDADTKRRSWRRAGSMRRWLVLFRAIIWQRTAEDRTYEQSAALAYNTLFSLLPILVLALMVMSIVTSKADTRTYERFFFNVLGLNRLVNRMPQHVRPQTQSSLTAVLDKQVVNIRSVLQQPGTGIIGFAVLLWGAISLMLVVEQIFNQIYRVQVKRSLTRRLTLYWCVLTLGPMGIAASIYFSDRFSTMVNSTAVGRLILAPATLLSGFASSWFVLLLLYKLIPDTLVKFRSALLGSLIAALLWELGKFGFGLYVRYAAGYGKWYGNLGLIPLFMFWIYLTWIFILIGLEAAFVHQHFGMLADRYKRGLGHATPLVDLQCVLPLAVLVERRFQQGHTLDVEEASRELIMPHDVCQRMLDALVEAGVLYMAQREERHYGLARSAENISLEQLLNAAARLCQTAGDSARTLEDMESNLHVPGIIALEDAQKEFARTHTLAWLAESASMRGPTGAAPVPPAPAQAGAA